jgi:CBS domain-containing protein
MEENNITLIDDDFREALKEFGSYVDITVKKITAILDEKGIKRVPVVDKGNKLVGIVSRGDLLRVICEDEGEETKEPL